MVTFNNSIKRHWENVRFTFFLRKNKLPLFLLFSEWSSYETLECGTQGLVTNTTLAEA